MDTPMNVDSFLVLDEFYGETEPYAPKQASKSSLSIEPCIKPNVTALQYTQACINQGIVYSSPLLYRQLLPLVTSSKEAAAIAAAMVLNRTTAIPSPLSLNLPLQIPSYQSPTTVPNSPLSPSYFYVNTMHIQNHSTLASQENQFSRFSPQTEAELNFSPVSDFSLEDDVETSSVSSDSASQKPRGKYKKHNGEEFTTTVLEDDKMIHKFKTGGLIKRIFQNKKGGTFIKDVTYAKVAPFTGCIHMAQNNPKSRQNYFYIELADGITCTDFTSQYSFVEPQGIVAIEFHKKQPKENFVVCYFQWANEDRVIKQGHYVPFQLKDTIHDRLIFEGYVRIFRTAVTTCPEKCCNRAKSKGTK